MSLSPRAVTPEVRTPEARAWSQEQPLPGETRTPRPERSPDPQPEKAQGQPRPSRPQKRVSGCSDSLFSSSAPSPTARLHSYNRGGRAAAFTCRSGKDEQRNKSKDETPSNSTLASSSPYGGSMNGYRVGTAKKAFQCSYKKCVSRAVYRTPLWALHSAHGISCLQPKKRAASGALMITGATKRHPQLNFSTDPPLMARKEQRSDTAQLGKGQDLGLHLSRAVDVDAGGPSVRFQLAGLACCSRPFLWGEAYTQGKRSLIGSDLQASATATRGQT
ncbi:unnamed protein product [Rangifer tarandus platyrhynchus]|uniref:Uncharacterized protein n=2 Tax=Rangifer tarandus platyrhynchus TaxID=3082113 RepID=A0ABN8Y3Q4_RANTA|nr:unnamed protein product [Rangifer tarandus platyrhynchus]CAI9693173.1 unnamed protein product [Rangifer tarandus platyrhynchus]